MPNIRPFLWFDRQAEEAARFYVSLFHDARIEEVQRGDDGEAFLVTFVLERQEFMALNGGPEYHFTPAISLFVNCADQRELDALWDKLVKGGEPMRCGWLTDRFGLTWQIIPDALGELMSDPDPAKSERVRNAMLGMVKLDIAALQRAYDGV